MSAPALSFVIPLYNSAATIGTLVKEIDGLSVEGGHEIVLVNDGSSDTTRAVCLDLVRGARIPVVYIEHARNFGEHNAVLTGWRTVLPLRCKVKALRSASAALMRAWLM